MMFTVVTKTRVLRVHAKSHAHLTQALKACNIAYLAIEADK